MNKEQFLEILENINACVEAIEWIENHPAIDAEIIHNDCQMINWLEWLYCYSLVIEIDKEWKATLTECIMADCEALNEYAFLTPIKIANNLELRALFSEYAPKLRLPWSVVEPALLEVLNGTQ